jgi:DNA end-binding protein Ku
MLGGMPASKPIRAFWKGAISFGLVHVPVTLHPASRDSGIDFDWLDKRSMDPVGYKRINKRTGREVTRENIVRGVAHGDGKYVVLTDKEIAAAYPKSTRTIEIESFVPLDEISFLYFDRPYYLAPMQNGAKVYALLRETLKNSGKAGIARVVIQTRQHLAALVADGPALVLDLLRWSADLRDHDGLGIPAEGAKSLRISTAEMNMAQQLVQSMSGSFKPKQFSDRFRSQVMGLVARKAKAGKTQEVVALEEEPPQQTADIIDLTELLKRSLKGGKAGDERKSRARGKAA